MTDENIKCKCCGQEWKQRGKIYADESWKEDYDTVRLDTKTYLRILAKDILTINLREIDSSIRPNAQCYQNVWCAGLTDMDIIRAFNADKMIPDEEFKGSIYKATIFKHEPSFSGPEVTDEEFWMRKGK